MANTNFEFRFDPIDYLVHARFVPSDIDLRDFKRRMKALAEKSDAVKAYRKKLETLSSEEIDRLVSEQRIRIAKIARQKAQEEERARPYNQPAADADFSHWAKMSYWTLDECVALSLGKNPKMVTWPVVQSFERVSPFASKYASRREIVLRAEKMGQLWQSTIPAVFLAWAERMRFPIPAELVETIKELGIQIRDWKTAHDEQKVLADSAQEKLSEELDAHLTTITKHSKYVEEMGKRQSQIIQDCKTLNAAKEELVEKLKARINKLETAPAQDVKPLGTRERESLAKLVIGMAIGGYAYDPNASRNSSTGEIASDLLQIGLSLDEDTIRKYLAEGRELLPRDETERID
jgi:hypothetical protein